MNILISGVSGYLGSNVIAYLSTKENTISIVDKNYKVEDAQQSYDIFLYFSNPNEINFNNNAKKATIDMVTHFYAIEKLLTKITVSSILYASTVRVYDKNRNVYASTHLFIESLLENYTTKQNITLSRLRFGNIFGGNINSMKKRDTLVPHIFIKSAILNNKIELLTDGEQYRDFTPMTVVNKYIDYIIKNNPHMIDICTGVNFKIIEVVDLIITILPNISLKISNKSLKEESKDYISTFIFSKDRLKKEIIKTIDKWRLDNDSNPK